MNGNLWYVSAAKGVLSAHAGYNVTKFASSLIKGNNYNIKQMADDIADKFGGNVKTALRQGINGIGHYDGKEPILPLKKEPLIPLPPNY